MSHPQGIPRRQPPQGRSSRGSWTPAGRVAPRGRRSSRGSGVDMDMRTQPAPAPPRPAPAPAPASPGQRPGARSRPPATSERTPPGWRRAGPGSGQTGGEGVGQTGGCGWAPGCGRGGGERLTRRSAQEKSFFFRPGAQLAGRPAASRTYRGHSPVSTSNLGTGVPHTAPSPRPLPPTKTLSPMEMGTPPLAWGGTGDTGHRTRSGQ